MLEHIKILNYKIPTSKPISGRLVVLTDLHFTADMPQPKLDRILSSVQNLHPHLIIFAGDLIHSEAEITQKSQKTRLTNWLSALGHIAPLILGVGNHDYYAISDKLRPTFTDQNCWIETLSELPNIYLATQNQPPATYPLEQGTVSCQGLRLPKAYYGKGSFGQPTQESPEILLKELKNLRIPTSHTSISNTPTNKAPHPHVATPANKAVPSPFNLLVVHSPVCLGDPRIAQKLSPYDLIISGHMHNGCVPPPFCNILGGHRGIISPTRQLFAPRCRGLIGSNLIAAPVTTIPKSPLNYFFDTNITLVTLTSTISAHSR